MTIPWTTNQKSQTAAKVTLFFSLDIDFIKMNINIVQLVDIEDGKADPQSQLPAGQLLGESEPIDSACSSSRAALVETAVTLAETSVPGGGGGYCTRSSGRPVPYSLGPRDFLPKCFCLKGRAR